MNPFEKAATTAAPRLGAVAMRGLAVRIRSGWPDAAILDWIGHALSEPAAAVLAKRDEAAGDAEAAAYLRGLAAAHEQLTSAVSVETVWSGPNSHAVPVRATAQALIEVITHARHELLLMTYSAKPHPEIRTALAAAGTRGVEITTVVETLQGAGSSLTGAEPAAAFAALPRVQLWHWPVSHRTAPGSKMHAKLAVADHRVLLISSANLTQSGVAKNIEAGLLVRGGHTPRRVTEHIAELKATGVLTRLPATSH